MRSRNLLAAVLMPCAVLVACGGSTSRTAGSGTGSGSSGTGSGSATDTSTDTSGQVAADDALATHTVGGKSYVIFKYEAVIVDGKARSVADADPAVSIDFEEAKAACEKAGYRLCTSAEWQAACKGPDDLLFAYAATKDGPPTIETACDVARTTNNTPGSLPSKTGSHKQCVTKGLEVYDMIGNASEWGYDAQNEPHALGVAFYQDAAQSNCDGGLNTAPTEKSTDMGFRCCK